MPETSPPISNRKPHRWKLPPCRSPAAPRRSAPSASPSLMPDAGGSPESAVPGNRCSWNRSPASTPKRKEASALDGNEVSHRAPERRSIALMPQRWRLFPHWTVARNLRFAATARRRTQRPHRSPRETSAGRPAPPPPHARAQRRRNPTHRPDPDPALPGKSPPTRRTALRRRRGPAIRRPRSAPGRIREKPANLSYRRPPRVTTNIRCKGTLLLKDGHLLANTKSE